MTGCYEGEPLDLLLITSIKTMATSKIQDFIVRSSSSLPLSKKQELSKYESKECRLFGSLFFMTL